MPAAEWIAIRVPSGESAGWSSAQAAASLPRPVPSSPMVASCGVTLAAPLLEKKSDRQQRAHPSPAPRSR